MAQHRTTPRMKRAPSVYGAGFVALDLLLSLEAPEHVAAFAGGTCGNVLTILSYLGWRSYPITRIGNDPAGMALRGDLSRWGVKDRYLLEEDTFTTPIVMQENRRLKNGEVSHRFIWQCPSCGTYLPTFRPVTKNAAAELLAPAKSVDVFFFDRLAPATLALAQASAERGAVIVFEPTAIGNRSFFDKALGIAHIVKYSATRVSGLKLPKGNRLYLQIETLGKEGLRYRFMGGAWNKLNGIPIKETADTSGAGDWCTAGILSRLALRGADGLSRSQNTIREALMYGQKLAAINCQYEGARGAMYHLSRRKIKSFVDSLKEPRASRTPSVVQQVYSAPHCSACWPS